MTRFVHPVPRYKGRVAVVSSGFMDPDRSKAHLGVDLMRKRLPSDGGPPGAAKPPQLSKRYFMESGTPALAFADGTVTASRTIGTGEYVMIDHPGGLASEYMHLRDRKVAEGDRVKAGQPIGVISFDPRNPPHELNHLHFQLRRDGTLIDPEPMLAQAVVMDNPWRFRTLMRIAAAGVVAWALYRRGYIGKRR